MSMEIKLITIHIMDTVPASTNKAKYVEAELKIAATELLEHSEKGPDEDIDLDEVINRLRKLRAVIGYCP